MNCQISVDCKCQNVNSTLSCLIRLSQVPTSPWDFFCPSTKLSLQQCNSHGYAVLVTNCESLFFNPSLVKPHRKLLFVSLYVTFLLYGILRLGTWSRAALCQLRGIIDHAQLRSRIFWTKYASYNFLGSIQLLLRGLFNILASSHVVVRRNHLW
jgi:hypothetical protein